MAQLKIGERSFEIAPYKLGFLRRVAPAIDQMNESIGSLSTFEGMVSSADIMLAILLPGLQKLDAAITIESMSDELGMDDFIPLGNTVKALLAESGFNRAGEVTAPLTEPEAMAGGASATNSEISSANSSPLASKAEASG